MPRKKLTLERKKGLYLDDAGAKGKGVFCTSDIRAGETLEVTPSVLLNEAATNHTDKTILLNYTFMAGELPKRIREKAGIKKTDRASVAIMGVAAFCNHSRKPNAEILWEVHEGGIYYTLQATRAIPKNTEICTSYGKGWFDDRGYTGQD